jgi:hypothetical protein
MKCSANMKGHASAHKSDMPLSELLAHVDQLSHQDKLRLIHFLLLAIAKEEGISLEPSPQSDPTETLLTQMASTEAVVWSPQADPTAVQALMSAKIEAEKARTLLTSYAQNANYTQFDAILARVPEEPPIEGDEL